MRNILFICTANRDRSRTAEIWFQTKYIEKRFRSAGINKYLSEKHGGIHLKHYMLETAEKIVCMEQVHADWIVRNIGEAFQDKTVVLHLGDTETFMSPQLIEQLEKTEKLWM
jgi:predicted protein tyrosine phosphatase